MSCGILSEPDRSKLSGLTLEPKLASAGWKMAFVGDDDDPDTIYHEGLNSSLADGAPMPFVMSVRPFEPDDAWMLDKRVVQMRTDGCAVFDNAKIRMATDPTAGHPVALEPTSYFNGLVSNEFCLREYQACDGVAVDGTERAFPASMIPRLVRSRMSNHIGVTSLAFDDEGRLLLRVSAPAAAVSAGNVTSSATGSIDLKDLAISTSLTEVAASTISRELEAAAGTPGSAETRVIAFLRHLERGGKPEFIAISRIRCRWADAMNNDRECGAGNRIVLDLASMGFDGMNAWMSTNAHRTSYALKSAWEFFVQERSRKNSAIPGWIEI